MLYVLENNGVYGLTKGQFSASAERGARPKKGPPNQYAAIDPLALALSVGATFVARSFSGDRKQLVPLIKAGLMHKGFALIDVISPCVTFNDHAGSTKSYAHAYEHYHPAVHADYVPPSEEIQVCYDEGETLPVALHDGGVILLRKLEPGYDPTNRASAFQRVTVGAESGEIVTGLLFIDESQPDMHAIQSLEERALNAIPYSELNPGAAKLRALQAAMR